MTTNSPLGKILLAVCDFYKIDPLNVISKNRQQDIVIARQMYFFISFSELQINLTQLGQSIYRDRTTVTYSLKKIKDELSIYKSLALEIEAIKNIYYGNN